MKNSQQTIELKDRKAFNYSNCGHNTPIYAIDANGNRWDFPSISAASKAVIEAGLCRGSEPAQYNVRVLISRNLRANTKHCYGLKFFYVNQIQKQ